MRRTAKRPTLSLVLGNAKASRRVRIPNEPAAPAADAWPTMEHVREFSGFGTEELDLMLYNTDPEHKNAVPVFRVQLHRIDETEAFVDDLLALVRNHFSHRAPHQPKPLSLTH